jgi:tRNA A-37 threonylcarbamoyl transferase component Bud32
MIFKDKRLKYFDQLALGLSFLKQNGITFHDLKTTNVMEKNGQIAIIDIGKSNVAKQKEIPSI